MVHGAGGQPTFVIYYSQMANKGIVHASMPIAVMRTLHWPKRVFALDFAGADELGVDAGLDVLAARFATVVLDGSWVDVDIVAETLVALATCLCGCELEVVSVVVSETGVDVVLGVSEDVLDFVGSGSGTDVDVVSGAAEDVDGAGGGANRAFTIPRATSA